MFRLESAEKIKGKGRYTFIGLKPYGELIGYEKETIVKINGITEYVYEPFLLVLQAFLPKVEGEDEIPFIGGAVGFIGYDIIRQHENIGSSKMGDLSTPDAHVYLYDDVYVYDHLKEEGYRYLQYKRKEKIDKSFFIEDVSGTYETSPKMSSNTTREDFYKKVDLAKNHLKRGDIFQVVLSQRFHSAFKGDTRTLYKQLKEKNPSPYMYYLDFHEYQIIGTSPESLVSIHEGILTTNPIAGTKPRGLTEIEDVLIEEELKRDEKELAEHYMLLDLGRNDLGRVCKVGTVRVSRFVEVERYRRVMHLVSEVKGELAENYGMGDVLQACLPAGTVSGAPKIKAMSIINELEEEKRGIYGGAVGYFSVTGNMDMALTIRTIIVKDEKAYVQAGAGIVLDSIKEKEYEETIHKAKALMEVLCHDFVN